MLMAVTGIVFILFVLVHMYGNLKAFSGHDAFNEYAEHLRTIGEPDAPARAAALAAPRRADRLPRRPRDLRGGALAARRAGPLHQVRR